MTNTETEAASANTVVKKSEDNAETGANSVFLEKVSDIPVVNAAKEYGTAAYNQVKQMNSLTNFTLSKAESTVLFLALSAKPFLDRMQPQAKLVDHMACRGLEAVEAKAPFIMMQPEELVEEARKLCSTTLETGVQKVDDIKNMGTSAVSSVKNYSLQKANDCLISTETLIDRYLPPAFGEGSPEAATPSSVSERASLLTSKLSHRLYGYSVKNYLNLQKLSQESVNRLAYVVELLQHIKENHNGKSVQDYVDEAKVKATWVWEELNKEPADADEADKSLEQRMLSLARRITTALVHTYSAAPSALSVSNLPQACLDGVQAARNYASDLFTQFDQARTTGGAANVILQRAQSTIASLQETVRAIVDSLQTKNEEIEMDDLSHKSADMKIDEAKS